jgi:predicted Zn-dependent protease
MRRPNPQSKETLAGALALPVLLVLLACATNPVTRESQLMLISTQQEVQIGQESAGEIQKQYGYYPDPQLKAYVGQVGQKLVAQCQRRDIQYRFHVLDTPVINAFALPGGYVYVTRGILARMNSEDEMAAVLGHELTHVAARHGAQELSKAYVAQAGLAAVAIFSPNVAQGVGQFAGAALNLAFLGYSRGLEAQADDYGITYAEKAGYNPRGAVKMFQMFQTLEKDQPSRMERFLMSHPPTAERLAYADRRVGEASQAMPKLLDQPLKRDVFLRHIDGLLLGQSKGDKVLVGDTLTLKSQRIGLTVPPEYAANLSPEDPDAQATFERTLKAGQGQAVQYVLGLEVHQAAKATGPEDFARRYLAGLKVQHSLLDSGSLATVQGEAMATRRLDVAVQGGTVRLLMAFALRAGKGVVLYGFTAPGSFAGAEPEFRRIIKTLAFLSESEAAAAQAPRLRLVTARSGDTWQSLAQKELGKPGLGDELAKYNGIFRADRQPEPGMLLKIPDKASLKEL